MVRTWHISFSARAEVQSLVRELTSPKPCGEVKKKTPQSFPGGSVVKNLPAKAGDTGLTPDLGRSHAEEQLRPRATTTEPVLSSTGAATTEPTSPEASALQQDKHCNAKPGHCS